MALKVLLTCAGGGLSPQVIRFIKNSKVYKNTKVYGVDMNPNASGKHFADYFQKVSSGKSKNFTKQIIKICKKFKINLIIPGSDEDALNLSKNRRSIETNLTKIACVSFDTLKILSNKFKTYNYLKKFNFSLPIWYVARNQKEFFKSIKKLIIKKKDIVIKPSISRGGRNVYIISKKVKKEIYRNNGRQIELNLNIVKKKYLKKIKKIFPVIVMEKLKPPCFDFDMLCKDGKLIKGVVRRRVNPSVPNDGHYVENRKDIFRIGEKISKCFKLTWLYDCDFMLDNEQKPKIIEINPRMSGSASVSVAAGIPLFDDLISIYKKKKIRKSKLIRKKIILPSVSLFDINKRKNYYQ
tara:strand:- start:292 stop:1347 length:1056 start_codon:yes stop_codon:yes gene_type:complete